MTTHDQYDECIKSALDELFLLLKETRISFDKDLARFNQERLSGPYGAHIAELYGRFKSFVCAPSNRLG